MSFLVLHEKHQFSKGRLKKLSQIRLTTDGREIKVTPENEWRNMMNANATTLEGSLSLMSVKNDMNHML